MKRYFFDLADTDSVTDAGGALLDNDRQAETISQDIAQGVRDTRPELIGQGYKVIVRNDDGVEVLRTAIDPPAKKGDGE